MTEKRFEVGNLKIQDNAPKGRIYLLDMQGGVNALCSLINGLNDKSNRLEKENEELKQRNNRQAKRLAELYELMAKKDWESLTEIIDDFCSCEEQLQRESGTYSDWND